MAVRLATQRILKWRSDSHELESSIPDRRKQRHRCGRTGTPQASSGRPDLTGVWDNGNGIDHVQPVRDGDFSCVRRCEQGSGARLPPDRPSYRPEFQAKVRDLDEQRVEEDTPECIEQDLAHIVDGSHHDNVR